MPELPEVETTRRGIVPLLTNHAVERVTVRERRLRRPVTRNLHLILEGQTLRAVDRRAKYLLLVFDSGTLIVHLGMTGVLRVLSSATPPGKHDHVDIVFNHGHCLRFRDPRRFGLVLWTAAPAARHKLLKHLGPEPWDPALSADYLYALSRGRKAAIKNFIMDGRVVVGVGNIYANESLHVAGIHPARAAGRVGRASAQLLIAGIRQVLDNAIAAGGTTLRDFVSADGQPGYFTRSLRVYARAGQICACGRATIRHVVIGQRSSFYCPRCQH